MTATRPQRLCLQALRFMIVVCGLVAAWTWRHTPNPDGISYVDVSTHFLAGHWPASGTGYWSPVYPTLLAVFRYFGDTDIASSWLVAHVLNLALFLAGFAALEYFTRCVAAVSGRYSRTPDGFFVWKVLVYLLFAWTSLSWITLRLITPDLAVAALTYLVGGLSVRIVHEERRIARWFTLGVLLGIAYLTKTAMLPIGVAILGTVALVAPAGVHSRRGVLTALAAFAVVSAPQVIYISGLKGSLTIGEVGRLAHAWYAARVPSPLGPIGPGILPAYLPSPDGVRAELPALNASDDHPKVYAVDGPFPATLPLWYDASYWYRRVKVPIALHETLNAAAKNTIRYVVQFGFFLLAAIIALGTAGGQSQRKLDLRTAAVIVVPALSALALYALSYAEARYYAPFAVLLLAGVVWPSGESVLKRRMMVGFLLASSMHFALSVAETIGHFRDRAAIESPYRQWIASADALRRMGVVPGTRIGFIGNPYSAYWAQLAQLRLVSVIPANEAGAFWSAGPSRQQAVLGEMKMHDAAAVVTHINEIAKRQDKWIPFGPDSALVLYRLNP